MILERFRPYLAPDEGADALDGAGDDAISTAGVEDVTTTTTEDAGLRLRDLVKELGHEYGEDFDDEKIARDLATRAKQAQELEQRVRLADEHNRLLQHHLTQFQQPRQQPQQPTEQQKRELAGLLAHWNKVPEYDRQWLGLLTRDDAGNLVAKPGARPDLPQLVEQYTEWQRSGLEAILQNPLQFVQESVVQSGLVHQIRNMLLQDTNQIVSQVRRELEVEKLFERNAAWMLVMDQEGVATALTDDGVAVVRALQELDAANPQMPIGQLFKTAKEIAEGRIGHKIGRKTTEAKKPEPETREGKKLAALRDRSRLPDTRAAGKPTETTPRKRTTRLSLEGAMLDAARDQGVVQAVSSD